MGAIFGIVILLLMGGFIALGVLMHLKSIKKADKIKHELDNDVGDIRAKIREENSNFSRFSDDEQTKEHENKIKEYESLIEEKKKQFFNTKPNFLKSIIMYCLAGVMLLAFIIVPFSFHKIDTGEIAVVKVWGRAEYTKSAGTYFDLWIGKSYEKYDTKIRQTECSTMAYSQDAQTMDVKLTVQYKIQVGNVMNINKEFGSLSVLESRIQSIVEDKTKATMSLLQAMKIIEQREMISTEIIKNISEESDKYYIDIVNVLITNIDFSDAFEQAVEDKMIAEQQQLKADYEAKKAEIEAQGKLKVAMLEAEAQLEKAKKEAEATEVRAEAEANALQIIQEAWKSIDEPVRQIMLQEMAIENWNGVLPETMVGTEFLEWLMGALNAPTTP